MREHIEKLKLERKVLKAKLESINRIIDGSYGNRDYFARKKLYYDKMSKIRKEIYKIEKKIEFLINLKDKMEKINEEQISKSNINK